MKKLLNILAICIVTIITMSGNILAMDDSVAPTLLHQPIHGFLDPKLRHWLCNMIYRGRSGHSAATAPVCILDHESSVCKVAVNSDSHTIVTASEDYKIRIWDAKSGVCHRTLEGHTGPIGDVKIIPSLNSVISASKDGTVRLWDMVTGSCKDRLIHTSPALSLELIPDGAVAVVRFADNTAGVWNLLTNSCTWINCNPGLLHQVLITPDGNTVITRSDHNCVQVWDTVTGARRYQLPGHPILEEWEREPDLSNCMELREDFIPTNNGGITNVMVSPDGQIIITADRRVGGAYAYDTATGAHRCVVNEPYHSNFLTRGENSESVQAVAFTPDGNTIAVACSEGTLRIMNIRSNVSQDLFTGGYPIKTVSFCPDANFVVGCSTCNTLHLWDISSGKTYILNRSNPESLVSKAHDESIRMQELKMSFLAKMAPSLLGQYGIQSSFYQYPTSAMLNDVAHTAVTTSKNHALVWNLPEGTLRLVLPCLFLRATAQHQNSSVCKREHDGLFRRMLQYGASWLGTSYNAIVMDTHGNLLVSVTSDGHAAQVWNIANQEPTLALEQLSVRQIALLREIQDRMQNGGQRLILRLGSDNYYAYQSLPFIIKNVMKPYIGIYNGVSQA